MTTIERTPQRLVLKSGSTTFTLDRNAGKATMQRKFLFCVDRRPILTHHRHAKTPSPPALRFAARLQPWRCIVTT